MHKAGRHLVDIFRSPGLLTVWEVKRENIVGVLAFRFWVIRLSISDGFQMDTLRLCAKVSEIQNSLSSLMVLILMIWWLSLVTRLCEEPAMMLIREFGRRYSYLPSK